MKRILVVDDQEDMRFMVRHQLAELLDEPPQISEFSEMCGAITAIAEEAPFDIVITDHRIPKGYEGRTISRHAKQKSENTLVVVMSSDMTDNDRAACTADVFLTKPFFLRELEAALKCKPAALKLETA